MRLTDKGKSALEDAVARESPLTIVLNNRELVTLLCSPQDLDHLAMGFLSSEGLIQQKADIASILIDERKGIARVTTAAAAPTEEIFKRFITSGCGRGASFYSAADASRNRVKSATSITYREVLELARRFQQLSPVYKATGGVHSAALCDSRGVIAFAEDIGRHNALDKVFGKCLADGIPTEGRIIITSGRISSEILLKVAARSIPVVISRAAPTDLAVRLADELGVTMLGFVRGQRMNIYANDWRVKYDAG